MRRFRNTRGTLFPNVQVPVNKGRDVYQSGNCGNGQSEMFGIAGALMTAEAMRSELARLAEKLPELGLRGRLR